MTNTWLAMKKKLQGSTHQQQATIARQHTYLNSCRQQEQSGCLKASNTTHFATACRYSIITEKQMQSCTRELLVHTPNQTNHTDAQRLQTRSYSVDYRCTGCVLLACCCTAAACGCTCNHRCDAAGVTNALLQEMQLRHFTTPEGKIYMVHMAQASRGVPAAPPMVTAGPQASFTAHVTATCAMQSSTGRPLVLSISCHSTDCPNDHQ